MNFSKGEFSLIEYISFSLSEEIDLFYCTNNNKPTFDKTYNDDLLKEKLLYIVDVLET